MTEPTRRSMLPRDSFLDAELVAFVKRWYSPEMAAQLAQLLKEGGQFAEHLRRSFAREMREHGRQ